MFGMRKEMKRRANIEAIVRRLTNAYFTAFITKNLDTLSLLYSDDIVLDEFGSTIYDGKEAVLDANKELFTQFPNLWLRSTNTAVNNFSSFSTITVQLEEETKVEVVDVIYFELKPPHKIVKIAAYGGKGIVINED